MVGPEEHGLSGRALIYSVQYLVDNVSGELVECTEQTLYMRSYLVGYFAESVRDTKPHRPFRSQSDPPLLPLATDHDPH